MIKCENVEVMNFEGAIRGARNPLESWNKSDSVFGTYWGEIDGHKCFDSDGFYIGPNDMNLLQRLVKAGSDERKFMRQILVTVDITAPLYIWKELDTYKVGTVANSCSTMHKLASTPITRDCFSFDKFSGDGLSYGDEMIIDDAIESVIDSCEFFRQKYNDTGNKVFWRALIQLLPESWNQMRTWTANYEVLRNIYFARRYHKLQEWRDFCAFIETLPYAKELICYEV